MFKPASSRFPMCGFLVLVAASALGCKMKPKELKRFGWVDNKLGGPDSPLTCTADLHGTAIVLDFDSVPVGSTLNVRGTDHVVATGKFHVELDVGEALGLVAIADANGISSVPFDPKIPILITTPTGTFATAAPPVKYLSIGLRDGAGKPMPFGSETAPAHANPNPTVWWMGMNSELYGPAKTLREVDWLAVEATDTTSIQGPTCKYQNSKTGAITTAPLMMNVTPIIIYDRRTGHVVDKKPFYAMPSCPLEKPVGDSVVAASASDETIKAWLKERRTKK